MPTPTGLASGECGVRGDIGVKRERNHADVLAGRARRASRKSPLAVHGDMPIIFKILWSLVLRQRGEDRLGHCAGGM